MATDPSLPPDHPVFAAAIARGQEHRPVADAADAEAYAARITAATYGEAEVRAQRPSMLWLTGTSGRSPARGRWTSAPCRGP